MSNLELVRSFQYKKDPIKFTISGAVEAQCEGYSEGGAIERVADRVENIAHILGKLVEALHGSRRLETSTVLEMLPSFEQAKGDDA